MVGQGTSRSWNRKGTDSNGKVMTKKSGWGNWGRNRAKGGEEGRRAGQGRARAQRKGRRTCQPWLIDWLEVGGVLNANEKGKGGKAGGGRARGGSGGRGRGALGRKEEGRVAITNLRSVDKEQRAGRAGWRGAGLGGALRSAAFRRPPSNRSAPPKTRPVSAKTRNTLIYNFKV